MGWKFLVGMQVGRLEGLVCKHLPFWKPLGGFPERNGSGPNERDLANPTTNPTIPTCSRESAGKIDLTQGEQLSFCIPN